MKLAGRSVNLKLVIALLAVLAVQVIVGMYLLPGKPDLPPQRSIEEALQNTSRAVSYEYDIKMETLIDGKQQLASQVRGERENQNRIHFKGRIFDQEIEFYQLDSTTYNKDRLNGEWVKVENQQINQQEIFMMELNPLASFNYKELNDPVFEGAVKEGGQTYWVYTASPVVNNPYMEILWHDFRYKFWLEPRTMLIQRAVVSAASKNNPADKLTLEVQFTNYNGTIRIKPPE